MSGVAADRLRRVQAALAADRRPAPDDLAWLLSLDPDGLQWPGEAHAARTATEKLVIELAARFALTARQVHELIDAYEGKAWPRERLLRDCPPRLFGTQYEICWMILRAYGRCPSEKTIRRILDDNVLDKSRRAVSNA